MDIKVYKAGTMVTINQSPNQVSLEGVITQVNLRIEGITYDISYWVDKNYKTVTLCENQFLAFATSIKKIPVGYK